MKLDRTEIYGTLEMSRAVVFDLSFQGQGSSYRNLSRIFQFFVTENIQIILFYYKYCGFRKSRVGGFNPPPHVVTLIKKAGVEES